MSIKENITLIKKNIVEAQSRSAYAADYVELLAVSKTKPVEMIEQAYQAGQLSFGENRVQEILAKAPLLPQVHWHLIGHLQTNKVRQIIDKVDLIHSLDSIELADEIEKRAAAKDTNVAALVQVNIAEDEHKFGIKKEELPDFLLAMTNFSHLQIKGLMTIGPFYENIEEMRPVFCAMRQLFELTKKTAPPSIEMKYLSMGMSHDYMIAVEEGANIVRVGSSIFGVRS
mgnify:CR=1 FL=1